MQEKKLIDFFIRQTAKEVLIDESIVDTIVRDQWTQLHKKAQDLTEMEIAGIGSIYPTEKKLTTRIAQYEQIAAKTELGLNNKKNDFLSQRFDELKERMTRLWRKKYELNKKGMGKQKADC